MGDYFRAAGYHTYYKGKWNISAADILIPGTHDSFLSYNSKTGIPIPENEQLYLNSNPLNAYGFSGWIGPDPHGKEPHKSGSSSRFGVSGRDVIFASDIVELIKELDLENTSVTSQNIQPWLIVASFVNPHDIALYGVMGELNSSFKFIVDDTIPTIPPPPTFMESLLTKPHCQLSYKRTYGTTLQPIINTPFYRKLYYQLLKNVDQQMLKVFNALQTSSFYKDTIVIFLSDHDELLGAHGGLQQKWYCSYEEAIHVPLIFHSPLLFKGHNTIDILTSHVDLLPTMLGLAEINLSEIEAILKTSHTEARPLIGRNLSPLILRNGIPKGARDPVYFMTDDDPTNGLDHENFLGWSYNAVVQPNHIETVIAELKTKNGREIWKYSRYFDNPDFWANPNKEDTTMTELGKHNRIWGGIKNSVCTTIKKKQPVPDEIEIYNITKDPLETQNLANTLHSTFKAKNMQQKLELLLLEQRQQKRLVPKLQES
jgi:arylsulfatase A-like enzyme